MDLCFAFLYYEHTTQSHRFVFSIEIGQGVPHARDEILVTSSFAGTNLENLR